MKKHVGNPLVDGEATTGLGTDESALLEVKLEKGMVEVAEEVVGVKQGAIGFLWEVRVAQGARGVDQGLPVELGEHVLQEVRVEVDLLLHHLLHLDAQREAIGDPLDVRRQHVVG